MSPAAVPVAAEPRVVLGKKVSDLRRAGWTPANVYGGGADSTPVQVKTRDLEYLLSHTPRTAALALGVGSGQEAVIVKGILRKPSTGALLHVDFMRIAADYVAPVAPVVVAADPEPETDEDSAEEDSAETE